MAATLVSRRFVRLGDPVKDRPTPAGVLAYLEGLLAKLDHVHESPSRPDREEARQAARMLSSELQRAQPDGPVSVEQEERFRALERWERTVEAPQSIPEA